MPWPINAEAGPLGGAGKVVEVDETYFGDLPSEKAPSRKSRTGRTPQGPSFKRGILSLVERGGEARSFYVERTRPEDVARIVRENIAKESRLHTDEHRMYWQVGEEFAAHEAVNHSKKEYGRYEDGRLITTNTVEGFFSVFKRGMKGIYQQCSEHHLHRYVANSTSATTPASRLASTISSAPRVRSWAAKASGSPMKQLVAAPERLRSVADVLRRMRERDRKAKRKGD